MNELQYDSADIVVEWLKKHGFSGYTEYSFSDLKGDYFPLRFDIYLPDYNLCIEVDGQQHYRACRNDSVDAFLKKREYARRKEAYCFNHNIRLIRIVYDELNYLDQTLDFLLKEQAARNNSPQS